MPPSDQPDPLHRRVIALEEAMMRSEHLLDQLNGVLCQVQDRLDRHDRAIERLIDMTERFVVREEEERSPEEERPPHY